MLQRDGVIGQARRAEPKPRKTCARAACKNERPKPAQLEGDPFCSADCCRAFHGVSFQRPRGALA